MGLFERSQTRSSGVHEKKPASFPITVRDNFSPLAILATVRDEIPRFFKAHVVYGLQHRLARCLAETKVRKRPRTSDMRDYVGGRYAGACVVAYVRHGLSRQRVANAHQSARRGTAYDSLR